MCPVSDLLADRLQFKTRPPLRIRRRIPKHLIEQRRDEVRHALIGAGAQLTQRFRFIEDADDAVLLIERRKRNRDRLHEISRTHAAVRLCP